MQNHLHAVIQICEPCRTAPRRGLAQNLSIGENAPRRIPTTIKPLIKDSLSSMVNHFKGNVKRFCNQIGYSNFVWQAKFYDRIIWDEKALFKIREYIKTNPERWFRDRNNGAGIFM
jgi:hypothetical protein